MDPLYTKDGVLVFAGQDTPRADLLAVARTYLIANGVHHLDADDALVDRQGLVVRAHWAGPDVGFCGETHPQAQAVTVVNLPGISL
jgi:hypothetical protein